MAVKTETTRVNLTFVSDRLPERGALGAALMPGLNALGYRVRGVRPVSSGARIELDDLTLTVTQSPDKPGDIRVLAFGPDSGAAGSAEAKKRFHLCAEVVRMITGLSAPQRIEWRHRGGFYITEGGQIAVVTGMRGTTGQGMRRKSTARAFSLYGPTRGRRRRPRRATPPFRIGGNSTRSLPEKLAQYALNATICCLSLPFGAALMTYGLLRGGSLQHSARWVALTSLVLAFVNVEMLRLASDLF